MSQSLSTKAGQVQCCSEQLGMSPKRYLLMRRIQLTRRDLRESGPTETNVTEIATRYGFWLFGRFAGEYKVLFDESPFTTLAGPYERDGRSPRAPLNADR